MIDKLQRLLGQHTAARFIVAGAANTVFGFAVYAGAVLARAPVWAALMAGVVAGLVFNYLTIGGYAFRQLSRRNFPWFALCYATVYLVNLGLIELLSHKGLGVIQAQALVTVPLAVFSYLMMRFLVFASSQKH